MGTWIVIASGESLTSEDLELVKKAGQENKIAGVVAVSNVGIDKAPWADFLVSHDFKWWDAYPQALDFKGRKFCRQRVPGTEQFVTSITNGCNSGLMAMEVALKIGMAKKIILLGFDMHGSHYFGPHIKPLRNTTPNRFKAHIKQFNGWKGCPVVNCNLNSSLKKFPFAKLIDTI